ncbi:MAG TPA: PQQ-binding-like beta-propeller repeat protein [Acidimicrobiales bacterium]|nr:PQQ-binding-like beta-propeller repeat protein [Acidimicrobiales bacterium]
MTATKASASTPNYFAYPRGAAAAPSACPATVAAASECTLTQALALVPAGGKVLLASDSRFYGNFSVSTARTSSSDPVTIAPASGVTNPIIDGDESKAVTCPTTACDGAALTVAADVFVKLKSLTFDDADNTTTNGGGAIDDLGSATLVNVTITGCQAYNGGGVAVGNGASLTVAASSFSHDVGRSFGGAIENANGGNGTVSVTTSTFHLDTAAYHGGAIENGVNAGVGTATVTNSTFSKDSSQHGGAIDNGDGGTGTLLVSGTTFSADSSTLHGGALDNGDGMGGTGTATVTSSTFSSDSSPRGGAIDNGEASGTGALTLRTSTLAGNSTTTQGAAIDDSDVGDGTALILSTTIVGNVGEAALEVGRRGTVQIAGSIVAKSSRANCIGVIRDAGYNLEDDAAADCGFSQREHDLVGVHPGLGGLARNGGPTETIEPSASSPVLNQIPNPGTVLVGTGNTQLYLCPVTDQVGARTQTETFGCAIGSVDPANDVPVVRSIKARFGPAAGGNEVTVNGGNFTAGATVRFGTASATDVSLVSSTQLTVIAPPFDGLDGAAMVAVTVTDSSGPTSPEYDGDDYSYYPSDWSSYLGSTVNSSFNPGATSINRGNAADLEQLWHWTPPASPNTGSLADFASPVVSDGVVYVGLNDGEIFAVSEATQKVLWSQFLGLITPTSCPGTWGVMSTAAVADDPTSGAPTVYVNGQDGYLYALDAATGDIEWRSVVGIPSSTVNDYFAWGSPKVANGKVYLGIASNCDQPLVVAGVLAFNQHSGTQLAYWDSQPAGVVGGSVWTSLAVLPDGDVVATTGNSKGGPQIANGESVVVLDGSTLDLVDSWMVPKSQQIWDSDFGGSPTLFTAYPAGVATQMVGACNKDGIYYALRADDLHAGPLWEYQMGEPTSADNPGECDAAAIWNGSELIEGGGSPTTIGGVSYEGSVQALNPTTGQPVWQTGLPGYVMGSPAEDGGGVVAAPVYYSATGATGVYLLSSATGAILSYISTAPAGVFAQPVFDGSDLIVGNLGSVPVAAYAVPAPATPAELVLPHR